MRGRSLLMLAPIRKLKLGFLLAALAGALVFAIAGPAAAKTKMVTSDAVSWKGTVSSTGEVVVSACTVKSDTEPAFPCQLRVVARRTSPTTIEVISISVSADGTVSFGPLFATLVTSKPPIEIFAGTGPCEEHEESDLPGTKGPISYPCTVSVRLTSDTAKKTST